MRQKSGTGKASAEQASKISAERPASSIVLQGLRGEESIAPLCREGIAGSLYYLDGPESPLAQTFCYPPKKPDDGTPLTSEPTP